MGSSSEQIDTLTLEHINHIVAFQQGSQIADMVGPAVAFFFFSARRKVHWVDGEAFIVAQAVKCDGIEEIGVVDGAAVVGDLD